MDKTKKQLSDFQKLVIYFIIYAFIGWICEEIFCVLYTHQFTKRGFLFGPICPIYGYGAIILLIFFKDYKKRPIALFFAAALVFSVFEYITDFFLQALFANRWWDYTGEFLNLNGRITLSFSVVWGIGALIFINLIHPLINKIVAKILTKIPINTQKIATNAIIGLVAIDTVASSVVYLNIL